MTIHHATRMARFIAVCCCLLTFAAVVSAQTAYQPNEVLVRFKAGVAASEKERLLQSLEAVRVRVVRALGVECWRLPPEIDAQDAVERLLQEPAVDHAEPNYLYRPQAIPDDPEFDRLWFLRNTGQTVNGLIGTANADIDVERAWDTVTGSAEVVVAVIDSGIAFEHPDLTDNAWVNAGEISDNGMDDDGNGYVDDRYGYDFVNDDPNPSDYSRDLSGDGHGTHVAGIIAARGDNGIGGTGVMWQARLMALQVFDLFETSSFADAVIQAVNIISAVEYAVENGAKIINCSFGGPSRSQFMEDALRFADARGVMVVAAAGNEGTDNDAIPVYPAGYDLPNIIAVAATDQNDRLASYSNIGRTAVDLAAPGGSATPNIYSTVPPERETLFFEDFESGDGRWLKSSVSEDWSIAYDPAFGSNVMRDSEANYADNENSGIRTRSPIDAEGYRGLHIQFRARFALEPEFDFLIVEGSIDGVVFNTDFPVTGSVTGFSLGIERLMGWGSDEEPGGFYLGFRLSADDSVNFDGVALDDIRLTGIRWAFRGDEYGFKSGTSMATPVVAGVAGLVWAAHPEYTHREVVNAVLNGVDPLPELSGKVATGGRINAFKALSAATTLAAPAASDDSDGGGGCFLESLMPFRIQ